MTLIFSQLPRYTDQGANQAVLPYGQGKSEGCRFVGFLHSLFQLRYIWVIIILSLGYRQDDWTRGQLERKLTNLARVGFITAFSMRMLTIILKNMNRIGGYLHLGTVVLSQRYRQDDGTPKRLQTVAITRAS